MMAGSLLATMFKFNRLNHITSDSNVTCEALGKSETDLMEVKEAKDKVPRWFIPEDSKFIPEDSKDKVPRWFIPEDSKEKVPRWFIPEDSKFIPEDSKFIPEDSKFIPEDSKDSKDEILSRSIYTKGFPKETQLDELEVFFGNYGKVETVFMKRDIYKHFFKGAVFVTFRKKEEAETFLSEEETKFKEDKLVAKMCKSDYFKKKSTGRKVKKKNTESVPSGGGDNKATEEETEKQNDEAKEKAKRQMTANALIHIKGMDPETMFEEIKEFFGKYGEVGYVDMKKGDTEGYIRMKEPNSAGPTLEKAKADNDGKIVIHGTELELRAVEGDEELEYWKKMFVDIAIRNRNFRNNQGGVRGKRRGRGGRGRRGGRDGWAADKGLATGTDNR